MFNKKNPSKKFLTLKEFYKSLHAGNLTNEEKNSIYNGKTTMVFAKILKEIINKNNIKRLNCVLLPINAVLKALK